MSFRIGLVGLGYVGKGMHRMFGDWVKVIYDPNLVEVRDTETDEISYQPIGMSWSAGNAYKKLDSKEGFKDLDLAIICVPTPMKKNGQCDTSIVEDSIKWLKEVGVKLILIKSTVEPGTTDRLIKKYKHSGICMSPEYMGQGSYFVPKWKYPDPKDPISHGFMIVGGKPKHTRQVVDIFQGKMGPDAFYYQVDAKTAEVIKYMENAWASQKVVFCNEFYEICKALGVDYRKVREGWLLDKRVERMHTSVFPESRGYGGHCLPKDISAIIEASIDAKYDPKLLKQVVKSNKYFNSLNNNGKK
jgi:nucleotide sugar dehydrogenase